MFDGALAQLGERFAGSEEVIGSSPICSTFKKPIHLAKPDGLVFLIGVY